MPAKLLSRFYRRSKATRLLKKFNRQSYLLYVLTMPFLSTASQNKGRPYNIDAGKANPRGRTGFDGGMSGPGCSGVATITAKQQ